MRRPQDEGLQDADDDVVARIEVFHQPLETRQLPRGRLALGIERRAQSGQQGGVELLALHAHQHLGEQSQFVGRLLHCRNRGAQDAALAVQEPAVDQQRHQEQVAQE